MLLDVFQLGLEALDLLPDDAAVGFQLGFARAPQADAAPDSRKVGPHAREPGQQVLQLRQLDLQLGLVAARPGREDVEDDFRPVHDPHLELALEVGALHRRELLVEDDQRGVGGGDLAGDFLDLSFSDQRGGVGRGDVLRDPAHDFGAGRVHQPGELFQMFGDVPCVFGSLAGRGHQHGALDRIADRDHWSDRGTFLVIESSRAWRGSSSQTSQWHSAFTGKGNFLAAPSGVRARPALSCVYGRSPDAQRCSHRAADAGPAERQRQGNGGVAVLGHGEIVVVGNVAQMLALDVESHLEFGAVEGKAVGIVHPHDQIQVASR